MASVERPGLWAFATLEMPPGPTGSYQTVALLLKIAGWIRLAQLGLVLVVGVLMLLMMAFMGAAGTTMMFSAGPWGIPGAALGGLMLLVVAVVFLVIAGVYLLMTYWTSWIYARWAAKDPRVLQHVFIYGIVTVVLAALGAVGGLSGNPTSLIDVALLVIGILLLIESRKPEVQDLGSPVPPRPEAWQPVEEPR